MPTPDLTPAQARVYWAMVEHRDKHGVWPTLKEIGQAVGIPTVTASDQIRAMASKGIAVRTRNAHGCSIHPDHMPEPKTIIIPIEGRIKAENMR